MHVCRVYTDFMLFACSCRRNSCEKQVKVADGAISFNFILINRTYSMHILAERHEFKYFIYLYLNA